MKKILYLVTESKFGGAQRYIVDLAVNLKNEYEITVAFGQKKGHNELIEFLEEAGIRYFIIPHFQREICLFYDLFAFFKIRNIIKEIGPDIIHLSTSKASILGSLAAKSLYKKHPAKIIYSVHGWVFNKPVGFFKNKFYHFAEKRTAKYKDRIICPNKIDYFEAKKQLKIDDKKLKLIYNGIDLVHAKYLTKSEAKDALFSVIENAKVPEEKTILIGSVGNLYPNKGFLSLIKALHYLIIDYGYNITAVIIGEGPQRQELEERIIKFHPMDYNAMDGEVGNKILLPGRINNAARLLPAFDFYVNTSLKEGFPYTILEAMGAGVPVIAAKTGGIPDMITDGVNGILIDPKNSKNLAKIISDLIKNPEGAQKLVDHALHDVSHLFNFNKMLEETRKVYEE
ncbi:MAG: Glycosyl transferase, group 1 [Parcubacteria group bacterium GW2011_GWE2_39_37]|uniref:Glycosyl transferase, group 1 n=1 Tax=Candidatus Falkowbacteria bacterium GW2011_GWF2_39_8 TaxID=1618642 RepID=A0A0G0T336_9BACT|nr:MAG: Glycosyl transferase, group 1 [Parcubacteria group bacterium GW2011_GWE2_39_37]KKR32227.1 MAG: Glycosyl transferase, group 1 [Candidatus Falkowbacteria bacterium GW2011_GWF2_39_8]